MSRYIERACRRLRRHRAQHRKKRSSQKGLVGLGVLVAIGAITGIVVATTGSTPPPDASSTSLSTTATTTPGAGPTSTTTPATTSTVPPASTTTTAPAGASPSSVLVEVVNGSGGPNVAGTVAEALKGVGFHINGTTDANSFDYTTSIVRYLPGNESLGQAVVDHLDGPAELQADPRIPAADEVVLIVGSSYRGVAP